MTEFDEGSDREVYYGLIFHRLYEGDCCQDYLRFNIQFARWGAFLEELVKRAEAMAAVARLSKARV